MHRLNLQYFGGGGSGKGQISGTGNKSKGSAGGIKGISSGTKPRTKKSTKTKASTKTKTSTPKKPKGTYVPASEVAKMRRAGLL